MPSNLTVIWPFFSEQYDMNATFSVSYLYLNYHFFFLKKKKKTCTIIPYFTLRENHENSSVLIFYYFVLFIIIVVFWTTNEKYLNFLEETPPFWRIRMKDDSYRECELEEMLTQTTWREIDRIYISKNLILQNLNEYKMQNNWPYKLYIRVSVTINLYHLSTILYVCSYLYSYSSCYYFFFFKASKKNTLTTSS